MYCPEKLKINKFHDVRIPKNDVIFSRLGLMNPENGSYSGDGFAIPAKQSKIDAIAEVDQEFKDFLPDQNEN